jgi:Tfp pilus assembly protein PilV
MRANSSRGFTILETVLAVAVFAMIGLLAARFLLATTRSANQIHRSTQAVTLRDMIFEQYHAYSTVNFFSMAALDTVDASAKDFFHMPDNFGFDGMKITTRADYGTSQSSCTVEGALKWTEGGTEKILQFSRVLTPLNVLPAGADVRVQALSGSTGVAGLQVSAPTVDGSSTVATTDSAGSALLRGVVPGDAVPITITGGLANYDTNSTAGNRTGYYIFSNNNYLTDITTATRIVPTHLNLVVLNSYLPARQITGHVINDDDPAAVDGQQVELDTTTVTLVYSNGRFNRCGVDIQHCRVLTDAQGQYSFYNVIAGSGTLYANGKAGSTPYIPPTNASFRYGYTNFDPVPYLTSDWDLSGYPQLTRDLHVKRKGSWTITPTVGGLPLAAGTIVKVIVEPSRLYGQVTYYQAQTDPSGRVSFYNTINSNQDHSTFYAAAFPPPDPGQYAKLDWTCGGGCMGQANDVSIPLDPGYQLNVQLHDAPGNPGPNVSGMTLSAEQFLDRTISSATTDIAGSAVLPAYTPFGSNYFSSNPASPFQGYVKLSNPSLLITGTLDGTTVDNDTNQNAPHVFVNSNAPGGPIQSDGAGHFSLTGFPYYSENRIYLFCDTATRNCYPSASTVSGVVGPLNVDTSVTLASIFDPFTGGWTLSTTPALLVQSGHTISVQVRAKLVKYRVTGTVMDGRSGQPAAGLNLIDGYTNATAATTQSDGSYSAWLTVSGRTSSARGKVSIGIPAQTVSSITYPMIPTVQLDIPATPDPNSVPLNQSFVFGTNGGGGV